MSEKSLTTTTTFLLIAKTELQRWRRARSSVHYRRRRGWSTDARERCCRPMRRSPTRKRLARPPCFQTVTRPEFAADTAGDLYNAPGCYSCEKKKAGQREL